MPDLNMTPRHGYTIETQVEKNAISIADLGRYLDAMIETHPVSIADLDKYCVTPIRQRAISIADLDKYTHTPSVMLDYTDLLEIAKLGYTGDLADGAQVVGWLMESLAILNILLSKNKTAEQVLKEREILD